MINGRYSLIINRVPVHIAANLFSGERTTLLSLAFIPLYLLFLGVEGNVMDFLFFTDDFSHSKLQDDVGA